MAGATISIDAALEALLSRHEERCVFLHPVWLRTWLSEFGERYEPLFIATDDAIAPLMRNDDGLTFIGDTQICDFMSFLCPPADGTSGCDALWQAIAAEEWTELSLWGLPADSVTLASVKAGAEAAGYAIDQALENVAPRLSLPATWEDYLASLGKKDRHELRRKMRRLFDSGGNVELEVYETQADVVANMDVFFQLHTGSRQDKTDFMTPEMESFFRRMASAMSGAGLVKLFILYFDRKPVAAVFCFDAGSHIYMYNSGYDPEYASLSVGLISKALCLRWAIENGKTGLDFLRGNEPYKYDLGATDREIYRLHVKRPA